MAIKCPKCQRDNPPATAFCAHCAAPLPSFPGLTANLDGSAAGS